MNRAVIMFYNEFNVSGYCVTHNIIGILKILYSSFLDFVLVGVLDSCWVKYMGL